MARFRLTIEVRDQDQITQYQTTGDQLGVLFGCAVRALDSDLAPSESEMCLIEALSVLEDHSAGQKLDLLQVASRN